MTFSEALNLLREGRLLAREGWHGSHAVKLYEPGEDTPFTGPFLVIQTEKGEYMPWLAAPADLVALDWHVL
jgi:hypothetical protein